MSNFLTDFYRQVIEHLYDNERRVALVTFFNYLIILFMVIIGVSALYLPKSEVIGFGILTITFGGFIIYVLKHVLGLMYSSTEKLFAPSIFYTTLLLGISGGFVLLFISFAIMFFTFITIRTKYKNKTGKDYVLTNAHRKIVDQFKQLFIGSFIIFTILIVVVFARKDFVNIPMSIFDQIQNSNELYRVIFYFCLLGLTGFGFYIAFEQYFIADAFQKSRRRVT